MHMKMTSTQEDKKVMPYSFLNLSLDYANQIKAEIICEPSQKMTKKEDCVPYQKQSSNFNYNSFTKQILLQKSFSPAFTPKKQSSEEIFQYLTDRQYNKNQTQNTTEKPHLNSPLKQSSIQELHIRPLKSTKLEDQAKQKLCKTYPKLKINDQQIEQMRSEQIQQDNKEDDKLPKKGLTYISKKLSQILRQKKRIKSSELFAISFFDDDEDNQNEERNVKTKATSNENENAGLKLQNEPNQLKESKQRRNVRRRIYDSINVMVALGVIKKFKNEYIYIEQKDDLSEIESVIQQEDILSKKKDYLLKLENDCLYKESCLNYLTESYSKMKILRKLNVEYQEKLNPTNENTRSSSHFMNVGTEQKIEFPFILMQNEDHNLKIQLRSDSEDPQKLKKVNDWTDYIEVSNPNKQSEIEVIRIKGKNLRVISDVDCISLLGSLQINEHAELFGKNQADILRDYDIINQHKLKKNDESSKGSQKLSKD